MLVNIPAPWSTWVCWLITLLVLIPKFWSHTWPLGRWSSPLSAPSSWGARIVRWRGRWTMSSKKVVFLVAEYLLASQQFANLKSRSFSKADQGTLDVLSSIARFKIPEARLFASMWPVLKSANNEQSLELDRHTSCFVANSLPATEAGAGVYGIKSHWAMTATMRRRPVVVGSFLKLGVSRVPGASWSYELSFPHDQIASRTVEHVAKLSANCWTAIMSPDGGRSSAAAKRPKRQCLLWKAHVFVHWSCFCTPTSWFHQLCLAEFLAIWLCALPHRVPEQILQPTNHIRFIRFHICIQRLQIPMDLWQVLACNAGWPFGYESKLGPKRYKKWLPNGCWKFPQWHESIRLT